MNIPKRLIGRTMATETQDQATPRSEQSSRNGHQLLNDRTNTAAPGRVSNIGTPHLFFLGPTTIVRTTHLHP